MIIELLHSLNERIVGVTRYREYVILATECNVYRLSGSGAEDIRPIHGAPVEAPTEGQDMSNPNGPGMAGFPADAWAEDQFPNRVDGRWMVDDTTLEIEHPPYEHPPYCGECGGTGYTSQPCQRDPIAYYVACTACPEGAHRGRDLRPSWQRAGLSYGGPRKKRGVAESKLDETKLEAHNVPLDPRGGI